MIREYENKTASGEHHDQEEAIAEVNKARRHVKTFFLDALKLYESKYLSKKVAQQICKENRFNIFDQIAIPLTLKIDPVYDRENFKKIRILANVRPDTEENPLMPIHREEKSHILP